MNVLDFAYEVIEMQNELSEMRREVRRLRNIEEQYNALLNESVAHGEKMMGGLLQLCLVPGVTKALAENAAQTN